MDGREGEELVLTLTLTFWTSLPHFNKTRSSSLRLIGLIWTSQRKLRTRYSASKQYLRCNQSTPALQMRLQALGE